MRNVRSALPWLVLSAIVIVLDLYTKHLIQQSFVYGEHVPVTGFFDLVRYHNTGAAFSFLADAGGWQHGFFTAVSTLASVVMVYLLVKHPQKKLFCFGIALVLGGALGNLYDRLTLGYVVDFLLFYYQQWAWPAFNVADSAICVGVGLLMLDSFKQPDTSSS
ncbi:signal peptidase II [Methylophilus sp. TWE2]|uniref:signal peptidase II n=1 Tax=Methylophilus sp. TWE2 TaxID=1662285 RepID=UPI0006708B9C|nr:signal peptidase II [Methylophilus sp. TWE2]AKR42606.1 peptidase A8 [Methylophilus sp. TWE2]